MRLNKEVNCPYCQSVKVVRNSSKRNGKQNLLCRCCSKQFQYEYEYRACDPVCKAMVERMLLRGSGIRDCSAVLGISSGSVLRTILKEGFTLSIKPKQRHYNHVQIDEQWSYVQTKGRKVWMIYAVCAESGEVLAATWGKWDSSNIRTLLLKVRHLNIDYFCTDEWKAFREVLADNQHLIGKKYTKKIEGMNTWFRARVSRLTRRTTKFSKKLKYHYAIIKMAIVMRNQQASYI